MVRAQRAKPPSEPIVGQARCSQVGLYIRKYLFGVLDWRRLILSINAQKQAEVIATAVQFAIRKRTVFTASGP
jgi:hypothetical protein